jgi:capsular polysaccharide transport system permease protein
MTVTYQDIEKPSKRVRLAEALRVQVRILRALVVRDMRTRFGRTHLAFLLAIAWPLVHVMVLSGAFMFMSRIAPIGSSPGLFIATGVLPYILVLYPARMMTLAVLQNFSALMFPIVKTTDLIIARAIVEFFSAFLVVLLYSLILMSLGVDLVPLDWTEVATAIVAAVLLGIGYGALNVIMMTLARLWIVVFILFMAVLYMTAGAGTLQVGFSPAAREWLWYNPLVHIIIWLRTGYFGEYSEIELSKGYVLYIAISSLFLGLVGDRLMRGKVLTT